MPAGAPDPAGSGSVSFSRRTRFWPSTQTSTGISAAPKLVARASTAARSALGIPTAFAGSTLIA